MTYRFRLASPTNQNIVCGLILFCLPGIYTALTSLGAGGGKPSSTTIANATNAILYGITLLFAILGGTIVNLIGPRLSLMLGTLGYPLYVGGLWYYDRTGHSWFPLLSGAVLGATSGILWTCVFSIAYAYASEGQKGRFLAIQWALRSLGASVGAAIAFACNVRQTTPVGVSTPVYVVFIVVQMASLLLSAFLIADPRDVVRDDGTQVAKLQPSNVRAELGKLRACFANANVLLLTPAMVVCEMPLALLSTVNGFFLNLRSRALASLCFQLIQVIGPLILVWLFDTGRGLVGVSLAATVAICTGIGMYVWLFSVHYDSLSHPPANDWSDAGAPGFFALYILYGWIYAGFQLAVGWCTASLSRDSGRLAQFAGYNRACSSLGMCLSFALAAKGVSMLVQLSIEFSLFVLGSAGMLYVVLFRLKKPQDIMQGEATESSKEVLAAPEKGSNV